MVGLAEGKSRVVGKYARRPGVLSFFPHGQESVDQGPPKQHLFYHLTDDTDKAVIDNIGNYEGAMFAAELLVKR